MKEKVKSLLLASPVAFVPALSMSMAWASSSGSEGPTAVSSADIASVLEALQAQISVSSIVEIIAYVLAAGIGLVFMWWAARKLIRTVMGAFRSGRLGA